MCQYFCVCGVIFWGDIKKWFNTWHTILMIILNCICHFCYSCLGAFAKLRKAVISLIKSVCMEELSSHWKDFHEIWYLSIFKKSFKEIQVSLKSGKNNALFMWRRMYNFDHISLSSSWNEKFFRQKCIENQNMHFMFNYFFFFFIMPFLRLCGKILIQPDRPHMRIMGTWDMRITCWITKSTNTHS